MRAVSLGTGQVAGLRLCQNSRQRRMRSLNVLRRSSSLLVRTALARRFSSSAHAHQHQCTGNNMQAYRCAAADEPVSWDEQSFFLDLAQASCQHV